MNALGRRTGRKARTLIYLQRFIFYGYKCTKMDRSYTMNRKSELFEANVAKCQLSVNLGEAHFTIHAIKNDPK